MISYLEEKGVKFEDERLNVAVEMISMCKKGRKLMDFFISNLTEEAIEAINSKQYINNIPGKNDVLIESYIADEDDPSFNHTVQSIVLIRDDIAHVFNFCLSGFHNKIYFNTDIGEFYTDSLDVVDNKIVDMKRVGKKYSFSFDVKKGFFGFLLTSVDDNKMLKKRENIVMYLSDLRKRLKSRETYINYDENICKNYYPNKYNFYNTEINKHIGVLTENIYEAYDCLFDSYQNEEYNYLDPETMYNMAERAINDFENEGNKDKILSFNDWAKKNNVSTYEAIDYDDWVKSSVKKIKISEMGSLPRNDNVSISEKDNYGFINPYKMRYEDDEEEEITINKKK